MYPHALLTLGFCRVKIIRRDSAFDRLVIRFDQAYKMSQAFSARINSARTCRQDNEGFVSDQVKEAYVRTFNPNTC